MTSIAALLVTHDSQRWIEATLASVAEQTRQPDVIVVVDDHSTDRTVALCRELTGGRAVVHAAASRATDLRSRIAQNFQQGVRACAEHDVVVLGDHDDIWLPTRLEHQCAVLDARPTAAMVASDGRLVDEKGVEVGGTLRGEFPVPAGFAGMTAAARMRAVLRHLVATGGASALRPDAFAPLSIPEGWYHDRWWSLVATAREAMVIDDAVVIDYRQSGGQEVGLASGSLHSSGIGRVADAARSIGPSVRKLSDIRRDLAPLATEATAPELRGLRLLRNLL